MKKLIILTELATSLFANEYTCEVLVEKTLLLSKKSREYHYMNMQGQSCIANKQMIDTAMSAKIECEMFGIYTKSTALQGLIDNGMKIDEKFCK